MNKILLISVFFVFLASFSFAVKADPFVAFAGEKVVIEFDSKVSVEMDYYYNLNLVEKCKETTCPLFENHSLKDSGKKKFVLATDNLRSGFYAFKVTEEDSDEFYYSSITIRPDYRIFIIAAVILLISLLVLVETNAGK